MKTLLVQMQGWSEKSVLIAAIFFLIFATSFFFCWKQVREQALFRQMKRNNYRLREQLKAMQTELLRQRQKVEFLKRSIAEKKEKP